MNRLLILIICTAFAAIHPSAKGDELHNDLEQALARLEEGKLMLEEHDDRSSMILGEASAMLVEIIDEHQIESPSIYHALGNAYMLGGDIGHAVLAYRRGEQLDPTNIELRKSLEHAREMVSITITPTRSSRLWSILFAWRGYLPRGVLWFGFVGLFTIGWIACSTRILGIGSKSIRVAGMWMIAGSIVPIGMLGSEWISYQGSSDVVITGSDVLTRTGPNDTIYDPVFDNGLQPGIEAQLIESRDGWAWLELADGSQCWVPMESIELVNAAGGFSD